MRLSLSHAFMISCISRVVEHSCFCEKNLKKFHVFMEFHAFVFWGNGMYVSHITNKTTSKKTHKNQKETLGLSFRMFFVLSSAVFPYDEAEC